MSESKSKTDLPEKSITHTHTPAPWFADRLTTAVFASDPYKLGHDMKICDIRGWGHLTGTGGGLALSEPEAIATQAANASLIAAAPELLAALKACEYFAGIALAYVDFPNEVNAGNLDAGEFDRCSDAIVTAVAAIAKAEGREGR